MKTINVVAAVIRSQGKVLLTSRTIQKPPIGWEFPGGKVELRESLNSALRRELLEELGIHTIPADQIYQTISQVEMREIHLHFIRTYLEPDAKIVPMEGQEYRWVELSQEAPAGLLVPDQPVWHFLTNSNN